MSKSIDSLIAEQTHGTDVFARNADAAATTRGGRIRGTAGRCGFLRHGSELAARATA